MGESFWNSSDVNRIQVAQDRVQWDSFADTIIAVWLFKNNNNLLNDGPSNRLLVQGSILVYLPLSLTESTY
jgi:hypothetical protein